MPSMMEHEASRNTENPTGISSQKPRALTYDESKAAEAAFRGEPFNPSWSASARRVYDGILAAMGTRALAERADAASERECVGA